MCGIVGYVGQKECASVLLGGLRRLEYRGYDSAGIAVRAGDEVRIARAEGKLKNLERCFEAEPFDGPIGLGHTRWATHGAPSERNAHPHRAGRIVIAHNGIIENHAALKDELGAEGRAFRSATDTEVVAHLIDRELERGAADLAAAVRGALARVEGSYAILVMLGDDPSELIAARWAAPMVVGLGEGENFAASDIPAILAHTRDFVFLEDGDLAIIRADSVAIEDATGRPVERASKRIAWDPVSAEKQGYKHFMLKEIFEQPARLIDTLRGRTTEQMDDVTLAEVDLDDTWLAQIERIHFVACGTSYYAAQIAKYSIERYARLPVEVELASEYRYRDPVVSDRTLCVAVSQSGETADTLAAMRLARELGARSLAIVNVIESTIARESDGVFYTHAGPEIGVASTKAFTTQLAAIGLMTVWLGRRRGTLDAERAAELIAALRHAPSAVDAMLTELAPYAEIARALSGASSFLYLGRGPHYTIACEGALKLKEISYIHAEGYAAGEMKHGPIALIDESLPVVVIAPRDSVYEKTIANLEEVRARGGRIVAIGTEGDERLAELAEFFVPIPAEAHPWIHPILTVVAVQLIAYHVADIKGTDIDQPRNLAKSVTVE